MRRAAVTAVAMGLLALAACGGDSGGTEEICNRVETEGNEAAERFASAGAEIGAALQEQDEAAALAAVTDAQNASADLVDVIRQGADDADDEALSQALDNWANELEAMVAGLDPASLMAGEAPDDAAMQAAADEVQAICDAA